MLEGFDVAANMRGPVSRTKTSPLPPDMLPDLAELITALGHLNREHLVRYFQESREGQQITKRQIVEAISMLAEKARRGIDTRARWYLKAEHQHLLPEGFEPSTVVAKFNETAPDEFPSELVEDLVVSLYRSGVTVKDRFVSDYLKAHPKLSRRQVSVGMRKCGHAQVWACACVCVCACVRVLCPS